jgi:hypothetical protein
MPFRLTEERAKVQFLTSARLPSLIYKACLATGQPSNTAYIQRAVCEALARDLNIPLTDLLAEQPPVRSHAGEFRGFRRTGPANTVEEVH